ncbi:MAG: hypothetical protein U1E76_09195 [Planctomycetota bacterium]
MTTLVFDRAPTVEAFADREAEVAAQQRILALARDGASLADACETMVPRLSITVVAWWTRHDEAFQRELDELNYPPLAPHGPAHGARHAMVPVAHVPEPQRRPWCAVRFLGRWRSASWRNQR